MDHSHHQRLTADEQTDQNLIGAAIYGPDDYRIGTISHLHRMGVTPQAVIDVGGFLGIGSKPVLVPLSELDLMRDQHGKIHGVTTWSVEELSALPRHVD